MVAKIKQGRSLIGALNYNENKVKNNKAQLIGSNGYFKDLKDLKFDDKLLRLSDLAARNERTKTNAVHISLNFANGDELQADKLQLIIADYMEQIGFGNQPYLAYRHSDAGHPHVHIVTTNIQPSGERISLHLLGKTKSEKARKSIEINYGLVKAENSAKQKNSLGKVLLSQVEYGKTETKRAITNVVNVVLKSYKFTSLPEFNAVLNQFNIAADQGAKDSRMYEKNGLVYWVLDRQGQKIGVPIKASSIYGKPTLRTLEDRFTLNEILRKPLKEQIKNTIGQMLLKPLTKIEFQKELSAKNIQVIFRQNEEGRLYGVTFIDHGTKSVFNGSDLGKQYSAAMLSAGFKNMPEVAKSNAIPITYKPTTQAGNGSAFSKDKNTAGSLIDALLKEEHQDMAAIGRLQQRKRRKKRKGNSL